MDTTSFRLELERLIRRIVEETLIMGVQAAPPVEREPVGNAWRWAPGTVSQWAVAAPIPRGWRWLGAVPLEAVGRERRVGEEQMAWAVYDPVEVIHE